MVKWCPEEDSNLHDVTRQYLKLVRLPIPPSGHTVAPARHDRARWRVRAGDVVEGAVSVNLKRAEFGVGRERPSGAHRVAPERAYP